jgi:SAM-dependent methyltransferase
VATTTVECLPYFAQARVGRVAQFPPVSSWSKTATHKRGSFAASREEFFTTVKSRLADAFRPALEKNPLLWLARRLGVFVRGPRKDARVEQFSSSSSEYSGRLAAEIATFENDEVVHDLPEIFHYWSNKYLLPKIQAFGFVNPDDFFVTQLAVRMDGAAIDKYRFISIGAGNCDTEIRIARALVARGYKSFSIECLDLNPTMLDRGRNQARDAGLDDCILPQQGDFNQWKPVDSYHAVIANQSLHHVANLEGLFDAIRDAITTTNGVLITSDMIGRNGHQRWPEALTIVQEFWDRLPTQYKYNHQLKRTEEKFVNWDCATEGFEGIRAQDILPLLQQRFHFDLFVPFSNVISPFIDRSFGPNFDATSETDRQLIDEIHSRDEVEIASGRITPTQMFAVLSVDKSRQQVHIPGLTPEICTRRPV